MKNADFYSDDDDDDDDDEDVNDDDDHNKEEHYQDNYTFRGWVVSQMRDLVYKSCVLHLDTMYTASTQQYKVSSIS